MKFKSLPPDKSLNHIVKELWIIESTQETISKEKIIPDGYCEIIIHYGDPYEINIDGIWKRQSKFLFAGQIRKFFFLKNTGCSGILGIKFFPEVLSQIFNLDMSQYVDKVIDLKFITSDLTFLEQINHSNSDKGNIDIATEWLTNKMDLIKLSEPLKLSQIIGEIIKNNGLTEIEFYAKKYDISLRELERQFKTIVGLSPKFFSRIIRLSHIFKEVQKKDFSWTEFAYNLGFYDQSHFIKNFKEFTGESPKKYGFDESNFANFFLKK